MRGFHNSSFDPPTLVVLEAAFDEAWLTPTGWREASKCNLPRLFLPIGAMMIWPS
jgi:hypothetical protein